MSRDEQERVVQEALRLAERNLESQVSIMIAADQRATTFSGMLITAVSVVLALHSGNQRPIVDDIGIVVLVIAALIAMYSARSIKIVVPGLEFRNFSEDIEKERDFIQVLRDLGKHFDDASDSNRRAISRNARLFNTSLLSAGVGFCVAAWPSIGNLLARLTC